MRLLFVVFSIFGSASQTYPPLPPGATLKDTVTLTAYLQNSLQSSFSSISQNLYKDFISNTINSVPHTISLIDDGFGRVVTYIEANSPDDAIKIDELLAPSITTGRENGIFMGQTLWNNFISSSVSVRTVLCILLFVSLRLKSNFVCKLHISHYAKVQLISF